MADNTITIFGNITREPEMRFTPNGVSKLTFGRRGEPPLARPQQTQEWVEQTSFFNVVCWASSPRTSARRCRRARGSS